MCLDSDKKKMPLCENYVIAMSLRKIRRKFHKLVFSDVCLIEAPKRNLVLERIVFEVRLFLVALPYFADSCSKPT